MMIGTASSLVAKMECPRCAHREPGARASTWDSEAKESRITTRSLRCARCGYRVAISGNLVETAPVGDDQLRFWDAHYNAEDPDPITRALEVGFSHRELLAAHYPMVRLLERVEPPLESSIELGCGSGAFSLVLKRLGLVRNVTVLDYSVASLAAAGRLFEHFGEPCLLVHSSLEEAPFGVGSFDLALSAGVLEHYRTGRERLKCMDRHLRLGRFAYVQAPISLPFYWFSRLSFTAVNRDWPFGYERPVLLGELTHLSRKAGAEILGRDHQYFTSYHLFTRLHRMPRPRWYTFPFANEVAILARRG